MTEVPPGIVGELLRTAVHLPLAPHVEGLVVHQENATRPFAFAVAEGRHIDAFRSAVYGVWARVAGALGHLLRLDHSYDLWILRVGLGVQDMDARRAEARHHQIAALDMGVRCVGTQARRAGVPAKVMQLVAGLGHRCRADDC